VAAPAAPEPGLVTADWATSPESGRVTAHGETSRIVEVRTAADLKQHSLKTVDIYGVYEAVDVGMLPGTTPNDRARVRLVDGTRIYIGPPWSPTSVRSASESWTYEGREVVVIGFVMSYCPPPPGPPGSRAYMLVSCTLGGGTVLDLEELAGYHHEPSWDELMLPLTPDGR